MKKLSQIAEEIGVPKQRVYRFVKFAKIEGHPIGEGYSTKPYYDEAAELRIKSHFAPKNTSSTSDSHQKHIRNTSSTSDSHQNTSETHHGTSYFDEVFATLRAELEAKNRQLETQAGQISELTAALENTTASLKAAQALHAATMQHNIEDKEAVKRERGIFARIFRKKGE